MSICAGEIVGIGRGVLDVHLDGDDGRLHPFDDRGERGHGGGLQVGGVDGGGDDGVEADSIEPPTAPEAMIATTAAEANMRPRPGSDDWS